MEVYFDGGFRDSGNGQLPCKKTGAAVKFQWKEHEWQILGLYTCEEGLVLDFAKQVPAEEIRSFDEKWPVKLQGQENGAADFSEETMEFENPFAEQIWMDAWIDGAEITSMSGCSCVYRPKGCRGEAEEAMEGAAVSQDRKEAAEETEEPARDIPSETVFGAELVEHYGLGSECGWYFERKTLKKTMSWESAEQNQVFSDERQFREQKKPPCLETKTGCLRLRLKPEKLQVQCKQTFETKTGEKGRKISFSHPIEGGSHVLQVEDVTGERLLERHFTLGEKEYRMPTHLQCLYYSFSDPEDANRFTVRDLGQGDEPICVNGEQQEQGATSIFLCGNFRRAEGEKPERTAWRFQASRPCFQPVERVCWGIMALVERGEEVSLELEWPKTE